MKRLFATLIVICSCFSMQAQKLPSSKVPVAVKDAFVKQYPNTAVKWEMEDGKYEASFTHDAAQTSVLYDKNGMAAETEIDIKPSELLPVIIKYVSTHYAGKKIKEAAKITRADGTVNYEAQVNGKDVIFDAAGNFLKEVKD
ncbi:MAG TPA: PepSY-like domain-containing protein [Ferruginibacter sp.]|nr:PepSY-like domain-containing protein [Ferruginibacter sp.]